jgi:restriction system protein
MARSRTILDDILDFPWWINLLLAAVVYAGLKYYLPSIEFKSPAFQSFGKAISQSAGLFAGIFILGAAFSAYHAWRRGELLERQTSIKSIKALSWKDFEYLVSEAYRCQGYSVTENSSAGADGGIDLVINNDGKSTLVQCKNWKAKSVGVATIRELYGVVTAEGASGGIVVCSGHYTKDAIEFSKGKPLTLVDGGDLVRLISDVQQSPKIEAVTDSNVCPVCRSRMVLRTAKRGKNAGSSFWGCSRFPKCRGTRKVI